jgi:hypothetical protein
MKNSVLFGLAVVLTMGVGCTKPVYLKTRYLENHGPSLVEELQDVDKKASGVNIQAIDDLRGEKEVLGIVAGRLVQGDNLTEWVAGGFKLLKYFGYHVTFERDRRISGGDSIDLHVEIKTAHVRSISTSMSATLVLRISYSAGGRPIESKVYRGVKTEVNWVSGEGEINELFCLALVPILKSVSNDLASQYKSGTFN